MLLILKDGINSVHALFFNLDYSLNNNDLASLPGCRSLHYIIFHGKDNHNLFNDLLIDRHPNHFQVFATTDKYTGRVSLII